MYTITAILWSYENNQLSSSEQILFSAGTQDDRPVAAANGSFEISEGGSIQFTLAYTHPLYDSLVPLETYVRVTDDGEEIFYGRILTKSDPTFTGQITYAAEGALSFLHDGEVPPEARDSKGQLVTRTLTAEEFFRWCIDQHNATVFDSRRQFTVGQITIDKKSETRQYQVSSYTDTRNAIDQYLRGVYGGYLRARSNGSGGQYIDWLKQYDRLDPQNIEIGENVMELTNTTSADGVYTVLRPVGQNGLLLDSPEIDLFPPEKMALMGRIVKTVSFNEADTKEKLQKLATDYAGRMEGVILGETSIRLIDMHYMDGTIPKIRIGDRFDHIYGNVGTEFTVAHMDVDFLHAENDTFSFKNRKDLEGDLNGGLSGGTLSKATSRGAKSAGFGLRYYHESSDKALLQAKEVEIIAEDLRIVGHDTTVIAENYERMSRTLEVEDGIEIGDWPLWQPNTEYPEGAKVSHIENHVRYGYVCLEAHTSEAEWNETETSKWQRRESTKESVRHLYGTEVIQNSSQIANVAGQFDVLTDFYDDWPRWEAGKLYHVGDKVSKDVEGKMFGYICTQQHTATSWAADVSRYWLEQTGRKSVRLLDGSAFTIDDQNGGMMTVGQRIQDLDTFNEQFTGSALWTQRDNITGVTGQFQIVTDPLTGEKHINILAGGGMRIKHDNVEYGLYHSGNVTGGMIVDLVNTNADPANWISGRYYNIGDVVKYGNDQYICVKETHDSQFLPAEWRRFTNTKIIGDRVDITATQVRVGSTSNVQAWMTATGQDIDDLEGLVADKATIADLNAAKARISTLESDAITTTNLQSKIGLINDLAVQNLHGNNLVGADLKLTYHDQQTGRDVQTSVKNFIKEVQIASAGSNTYKLQYKTYNDSDWQDAGNFSRATTLDGTWSSGGRLVVRASPQGEVFERTIVQKTSEADWGNGYVNVPIYAYFGSHGQYEENTWQSVYIDFSSKLKSRTGSDRITENGTYTPPEGFIGFGEIEVDVSGGGGGGDIENAKSRFNAGDGSYYIESYDNRTGNSVSGSSITYRLATTGIDGATRVIMTSPDGTRLSNTPALDVGDLYFDGQNSVDVTHGSWTIIPEGTSGYGSVTFSPTEGIGTSQTLQIGLFKGSGVPSTGKQMIRVGAKIGSESWVYPKSMEFAMATDGWTNNQTTVTLTADGTRECTLLIDASSVYTDGQDSVEVAFSDWHKMRYSSGEKTGNRASIDIGKSAGTGETITLEVGMWLIYGGSSYGPNECYIGASSHTPGSTTMYNIVDRKVGIVGEGWSGNKQNVNLVVYDKNDTPGTVATLEIDASSIYTSGKSDEKSLVRTRFGASSGQYYVEAYENTSGAPGISGASVTYKLATSGSTSNTKVVITNSSGTQISSTPEISVGSLYTSGQNAVTLSNPSWSNALPYTSGSTNTVSVSTSGRPTALTKSVPVTLAQDAWADGSKTIKITTTSGSIVAQSTVTAPSATVTAGTWTNGAVTVTAKHGTKTLGSVDVTAPSATVTAGTWENGVVTVTAKHGTKTLGSKDVTIPAVTVSAGTWSNGTVTVNAVHGTYTAGTNVIAAPNVTITCDCTDLVNPGYNEGDKNDNTITITAKHGTATKGTGSQVIHMTKGAWSSGHIAVNCRLKDDNGKLLNRIWITDPYKASVTLTYKGSVGGVYTYTTSTYVSGLSSGSRYTMHFNK